MIRLLEIRDETFLFAFYLDCSEEANSKIYRVIPLSCVMSCVANALNEEV